MLARVNGKTAYQTSPRSFVEAILLQQPIGIALADAQDFGNAGYPTFLAEIASTFNEHLLIEHMLKNETDDLVKLSILDAYLDQVRGTIYRHLAQDARPM